MMEEIRELKDRFKGGIDVHSEIKINLMKKNKKRQKSKNKKCSTILTQNKNKSNGGKKKKTKSQQTQTSKKYTKYTSKTSTNSNQNTENKFDPKNNPFPHIDPSKFLKQINLPNQILICNCKR